MNDTANALDKDQSEFVEVDPTGRYGRYNEILGKGASKIVYKGFDEYEGIEVAWNQVKLYDFLQSPEDLERLYCEIHLLKTLKHNNIMKLYTSWVDTTNRNMNFVTEMFTSGTLRQFRQKHKRVNIRAVKHWCRQILRGLVYLHSHDPPVIHRDLKCDNIFVNGNQGEVKIGDLGLAAILRKSHAARCVGTPEFMAPEVYEEEYNELVDIYAFGMCVLEMVTFEYPYSECTHPAQIYKKVISGKKPDALYKVNNPEVRQFIEKCLATVSRRLPACELLMDPFLQIDDDGSMLRSLDYFRDSEGIDPRLRSPPLEFHHLGYSNYPSYESYDLEDDLYCNPLYVESNEIDLFRSQDDENRGNANITVKGTRSEDGGIFLRIRMADKEGRVRNIYFPFDIEADTAFSVASEMVAELDMNDKDATQIAGMIDGEIVSLVPEWKGGLHIKESTFDGQNCASNGSFINDPSAKNVQVPQFHGRFEEVMRQCDGLDECVTEGAPVASSRSGSIRYSGIWAQHSGPKLSSQGRVVHHLDHGHEPFDKPRLGKNESNVKTDECVTEGAPMASSRSGSIHYSGIWAQHGGPELSSQGRVVHHLDHDHEPFQEPNLGKNESNVNTDAESKSNVSESSSPARDLAEDYEKEIQQELRWLKAKYQMQLRELRNQQVGSVNKEIKKDEFNDEPVLKSFDLGKNLGSCFAVRSEEKWANWRVQNYEAAYGSCSPVDMVMSKSFYRGALVPQSLHRATSLPVDAVDF